SITTASSRRAYPPHPSTRGGQLMANPVKWFEVMGKDSAGLQRFYRDVFGWKLSPPVKEMGNYSMLERPDAGIGGGFGEGDARVSVYIEVADPQRFVDKAVASGATVLMPVTTITPTTTIAMLLDPAGNTFGVMKPPVGSSSRPVGSVQGRHQPDVASDRPYWYYMRRARA